VEGEENMAYQIDLRDANDISVGGGYPFAYTGGTTQIDLPVASGLAAGDYTFVISSLSLTQDLPYGFTMKQPAPVEVTITTPAGGSGCAGNLIEVKASAKGGNGGFTYAWENSTDGGTIFNAAGNLAVPADGALLKTQLNVHTYYRVTATDSKGCNEVKTSGEVEAIITPTVDIVQPLDTGCFQYDLHNLEVLQTNPQITDYSYELTLHNAYPKKNNSTLIPENKYILRVNSIVYARVSDLKGTGCSNVDSAFIYINGMEACYPITIPTMFSPDGNGINDYFVIDGLEEYNNPEIIIFDRYKKEVFRGGKEDVSNPGWDGKYLGKDLPSGDYWYQINFQEIKTKTGNFSLKRIKE
jgi:gliding motility-associated-like protein